jgi:hypothetical protein
VGSIDDAIINQMEQIQREISESQDLVGELEDMASLVSEYQTDPVYSLKAKVNFECYGFCTFGHLF